MHTECLGYVIPCRFQIEDYMFRLFKIFLPNVLIYSFEERYNCSRLVLKFLEQQNYIVYF